MSTWLLGLASETNSGRCAKNCPLHEYDIQGFSVFLFRVMVDIKALALTES